MHDNYPQIDPMNRNFLSLCFLAAFAGLSLLPCLSNANITITAEEQGGDVVFSYSGSITTSTLSDDGTFIRSAAINAGNALINFATTSGSETVRLFSDVVSEPASFGTGMNFGPFSETGDSFTVNKN